MQLFLVICLLLAHQINSDDDSKWAWGKSSRDRESIEEDDRRPVNNDRTFDSRFSDQKGRPRYEIYEPEFGSRPGPYRPQGLGPPPPYGLRPDLNRPGLINGQIPNRPLPGPIVPGPIGPGLERPGGVYGPENPDFNYGGGYGQNGNGILTGPVPSWVREPPFRKFDTCKCTEKFNCQSPGISYGHCDIGKSYCCFNRNGGIVGGPLPSRPIHSPENGILVGPGGPIDRPEGPLRPIDRPGDPEFLGRPPVRPGFRPDHQDGLLIGPGIGFGRPGRPVRPGYGEIDGVLVGPRPDRYTRPGPGGYGADLPNGGFGLARTAKKKD